MKTEEAVTAFPEGSAAPLSSHAFLDEFALAYPGRSLNACAPSPRPCWSMLAGTSTGGRRATPSGGEEFTYRLERINGAWKAKAASPPFGVKPEIGMRPAADTRVVKF
jgi:hypothetical protein